jgi:hypothetical protein
MNSQSWLWFGIGVLIILGILWLLGVRLMIHTA